ncbi:MAG: hypothetical protein IPN36_10110 [Bacteroidetes bacterium]|nr:hypothetical protein [Bacteroidota bacterium]
MKKLIYLFSAVAMSLVVSCGPSAEEKAAEEKEFTTPLLLQTKRIQDSLAVLKLPPG